MGHIYKDLEIITGEPGLMTHMLPRAMRAVEPWLREHVTEPRFWDGRHDPTHIGEIEIPRPSKADRKTMFARYAAQPNPLEGKESYYEHRSHSKVNHVGKTQRRIRK